ncbi:hypothetical protein Dimus_015681, partial [Dionaea muscipula]
DAAAVSHLRLCRNCLRRVARSCLWLTSATALRLASMTRSVPPMEMIKNPAFIIPMV